MNEQKKQRFYYVQYCQWGVNVSPLSMNGNAFSYYAFTSYQEREKWLEEHEFDQCSCNYVYASITRKELQERIGKWFVIVQERRLYNDKDDAVAHEVLAADDVDVPYYMLIYRSF